MALNKYLLRLLILTITIGWTQLSAQKTEGVVTYNRTTDWISIASKLKYMSQEEIDRWKLTWGNSERKGTNFELYFKDNKSVYTYKEEEESSDYSWRKTKLVLTRDYTKGTLKDLREEMSTTFLLEEELPKTKWKILNEIKEIEGYLCMKAETTNPVKGQTIHAWFTDAIPFNGGPEGYGGLPGLIMELDINEGDALITATKVELERVIDKLPIPKKMKGKKTTREELDARIAKFIVESEEGQKNPFWRIRF